MRIISVDDERLALRQFAMEIEDISGIELAGSFTNPLDALKFIRETPVDAAFLDIEMPELNGIVLAERMREILPDLVIIFITGYEQYTLEALKVKADYYMTKPYSTEDIREVLERAKLLAERQRKRVYIRTFGRFDIFIDKQAVYFSNTKAKELLALCVDHRGGTVTIEEASDKLWENRVYDNRVKNLYRKAVMHIRQVLAEYGAEDIFSGGRGSCQIDVMKIDCDYYELLKGNPEAVRAWKITGSYLQEYSWAEETCARLEMTAGRERESEKRQNDIE